MFHLVFSIALTGVSLVVLAIAITSAKRRRARLEARALDRLRPLGLRIVGDVLGEFELSGDYEGIAITAKSRTERSLPGRATRSRSIALLTFPCPSADLMVCRLSDRDAALGPWPSTPRTLTGYWRFDEDYAIYAHQEELAAAVGLRTAARPLTLRWIRAHVLDRLLDLGLEWIRVRDGTCEIALAPFRASTAGRTLTAARVFTAPADESPSPPPTPTDPPTVEFSIAKEALLVAAPILTLGASLAGGIAMARHGALWEPGMSDLAHGISCILLIFGTLQLPVSLWLLWSFSWKGRER